MSFYIEFIHVTVSNIVLLLFILSLIGYILQDQKTSILNSQFFKYYIMLLAILVFSGFLILIYQGYWFSFPMFKYKLILVFLLTVLSIIYYLYQTTTHRLHPSILIVSFMLVYSISLLIGRYSNG